MLFNLASLLVAAGAANAATLWSGSFNGYSTATDFDKWSWSNQVGAYQWYIHGSQATTRYLALSSAYKNPAQTTENQGLKLTIDSTARWNGQTMWRTELIPQTSVSIASGQTYYHFSLKRTNTNPPRSTYEHQVVFFESHFTELKYGVGSDPTALQWFVGGVSKWSTAFNADTWYNFAYDINFSSGTVGLWASTGSNPLVRVVSNIAGSPSSNSADWHLGVLAFGSGDAVEDWYFSGVYVENGTITTSVGSGQQTTGPTTQGPTSTTTTTKPVTTSTPTTTTTTAGPVQTQYGQCGGTGWTGPTTCVSPYTCKKLNDFYHQCL